MRSLLRRKRARSCSTTPNAPRHLYELPGSGTKPGAAHVALTFDDGPSPEYTPAILEILAAYDIRATFFMVGEQAERRPDLVRAVAAAGHTVGNHTWNHLRLTTLDDAKFDDEVDRTNRLLSELAGERVHWLRPPYGELDATALARLAVRSLRPVMWSVDPEDWKQPGVRTIARHVARGARPGAIVVLHDGLAGRCPPGANRTQTVSALPSILDGYRARGYQAVAL